ncbi:hypothetical protein [Pseudomonas frederiksbergensis]|uniref:hypothetical protein n=1 Tax=Pseudomonas frederiksbergensis TaxID=104087 RepID=UPI003D2245CC
MEDQQLKRQLSGIAADLKWSAVELARIAVRLSHSGNDPDAQALQRMITVLRKDEESLDALGDQVRKGHLSHQKAELSRS